MTDQIILRGTSKELRSVIMQIMAFHQLLETKDIGTIYAAEPASPPVVRRNKPQICLSFLQDSDFKRTGTRSTVPHGRRRAKAEISFRLMDENSQSISEANARSYAQRIKQLFMSDSGFVWSKGKTMYRAE